MLDLPRLPSKERLILQQLVARGESYGLELVENSDGALKRGTVYVFLNRMEEKGFVESRLEEPSRGSPGAPRRIYKPTGLGERLFAALERASAALSEGIA